MCLNNSELLKYRLLCLRCRFKTPLVFGIQNAHHYSRQRDRQGSVASLLKRTLSEDVTPTLWEHRHQPAPFGWEHFPSTKDWLGPRSHSSQDQSGSLRQRFSAGWEPASAQETQSRGRKHRCEFPPHYRALPGLLRVLKSCEKNPLPSEAVCS